MSVPKPIYVLMFFLIVGLLGAVSPTGAQVGKDNQSFNNKQLQRLFSGSTLQADGLPCQEPPSSAMGIGKWDFTLNKDGSIEVKFTCNAGYPEQIRSSGKWRVEGNKFCLEDQNGIISEFSVKTNDKCWLLRPGTSRFEAYDSNLTKVWEFLVFSPNLPRHYHKQITELKKLGDELLGAVSPTGTPAPGDAGMSLKVEAITLPPAPYKALPKGTKIKYDDRIYRVTRTDGFLTVYRSVTGDKLSYLNAYALFDECAEDFHVSNQRGITPYAIKSDSRKILETFWPLEKGKKIT